MYLKSMRIHNECKGVVIREIIFRKGANFVVDGEHSKRHNKVGKTTFLKLIDIVMGAKNRDDLYRDRETGIVDDELRNLINDEKISVEMTLVDTLDRAASKARVLKVQLYARGKYFVDGDNVSAREYRSRLNKLLFGRVQPKPTVRQLIGSFVRVSLSGDKSGFLRYLSYAKIAEYRAVYNLLFRLSNPDVDQRRMELRDKIAKVTDAHAQFKMLESDPGLCEEHLSREELFREYVRLNDRLNSMTNSKLYRENLSIVQKCRLEYQQILDDLSRVDYRINCFESAIAELVEEFDDLSIHKQFYDEVSPMLAPVHRSFEELVRFNSALRTNKRDYLNDLVLKLCEQRKSLMERKEEILAQYNDHLALVSNDLAEDYHSSLRKMLELRERIGRCSAYETISGGFVSEIGVLRAELNQLRQSDDTHELYYDQPEVRMERFNSYFTPLAYRINRESPILRYERDDLKFPLEIEGVSGSSTGTRKSLVAAFDLAYQEFSHELQIEVPRFVVHDVVETVEGEGLRAIVSESNRIGCQFLVAVLREKLVSSGIPVEEREACSIVELSESDKLFEGTTVDAALRERGVGACIYDR